MEGQGHGLGLGLGLKQGHAAPSAMSHHPLPRVSAGGGGGGEGSLDAINEVNEYQHTLSTCPPIDKSCQHTLSINPVKKLYQ